MAGAAGQCQGQGGVRPVMAGSRDKLEREGGCDGGGDLHAYPGNLVGKEEERGCSWVTL